MGGRVIAPLYDSGYSPLNGLGEWSVDTFGVDTSTPIQLYWAIFILFLIFLLTSYFLPCTS